MNKKNIYQRMNSIMEEVHYIYKGGKNEHQKYKFVPHDAVTAAIHPQLVKHGIYMNSTMGEINQDGNRTSVRMDIEFINIDDPKDKICVSYWGHGIDTQDKGIGKAVSYAVKYCLLKMFCLETGDDVERDNIDYQGDDKLVISNKEYLDLVLILKEYPELKDNVTRYVSSKYHIDDLKDLTVKVYKEIIPGIRKSITKLKAA